VLERLRVDVGVVDRRQALLGGRARRLGGLALAASADERERERRTEGQADG
jgi:hypothetical protein